jgi:hypothetical protein
VVGLSILSGSHAELIPAVLGELDAASTTVLPPFRNARYPRVAFLAACWAAWRGFDTFRRYIRRFVTNPLHGPGARPPRCRRPPDRGGSAHGTPTQPKPRRRSRAAGAARRPAAARGWRSDRTPTLNPRNRLARARLEGRRVDDDHVLGTSGPRATDAVHAGELERSVRVVPRRWRRCSACTRRGRGPAHRDRASGRPRPGHGGRDECGGRGSTRSARTSRPTRPVGRGRGTRARLRLHFRRRSLTRVDEPRNCSRTEPS